MDAVDLQLYIVETSNDLSIKTINIDITLTLAILFQTQNRLQALLRDIQYQKL